MWDYRINASAEKRSWGAFTVPFIYRMIGISARAFSGLTRQRVCGIIIGVEARLLVKREFRNLNIDLLRCEHMYYSKGEELHLGKDSDEIIYCLKGWIYIEAGTLKTKLYAGEMLYVPYGSKCAAFVILPKAEYCEVDFAVRGKKEKVPLFSNVRLFDSVEADDYEEPLLNMINYGNLPDGSGYYAAFSELCKVIDMLVGKRKSLDPKVYAHIKRSIDFIEENYMYNTPMSDISNESGLSPSSLERAFGKCFGMTPVMYRNMVRVKQAKRLLVGGTGIAETAEKVGFCDAYHFSNTFKRFAGMSPGAYIKHMKKN